LIKRVDKLFRMEIIIGVRMAAQLCGRDMM